MATQTDRAVGLLVRTYREAAGLGQEALAEMLSREIGAPITQNRVSELERGERWAKIDERVYGALCRVLNIPRDEIVNARMGLPPEDGKPQPATLQDVIAADPSLSDAAKEHLINQYGLLQAASRQARAEESRRRKA